MQVRQTRIAIVTSTVVGLSVGGALLGTGAAFAASPAGPPLAGTTQTIFVHPTANGSSASGSISFSGKTFTDSFAAGQTSDRGTYAISGSTLTMTVKSSKVGDKGCAFTATFSTSTARYAGKYTCPGGYKNTFAVTTGG